MLMMILAASVPVAAGTDSRAISFDKGWRFSLSDSPSMSGSGYDDSGWRLLNLPHDWAIEGNFSEDNSSGTGGGALPGGVGWYRKTFDVPSFWNGKQIYIDFDRRI